MTREEDFKEEGRIAVNKYARELGDYTFGEGSMVEMFIQGAIYADQHPRKGLVDIEKACTYLESVFKQLAGYYSGAEYTDAFRKAMED